MYMESRKTVLMNLFSGQQWRNKGGEQTYGHGGREGGRGGDVWGVTWKFTIPYVKWIANGNLLCDSGNANRSAMID